MILRLWFNDSFHSHSFHIIIYVMMSFFYSCKIFGVLMCYSLMDLSIMQIWDTDLSYTSNYQFKPPLLHHLVPVSIFRYVLKVHPISFHKQPNWCDCSCCILLTERQQREWLMLLAIHKSLLPAAGLFCSSQHKTQLKNEFEHGYINGVHFKFSNLWSFNGYLTNVRLFVFLWSFCSAHFMCKPHRQMWGL